MATDTQSSVNIKRASWVAAALFAISATTVGVAAPLATPSAASQPDTSIIPPPAYSHERAVMLYRAGKYAEAETLCKTAIQKIEAAEGPRSSNLAGPLDDLASVYLRLARFADARPVIERAESVLDKSVPEQAIAYGRLCINKGWRLYSLGEAVAAGNVFAEGRSLLERYERKVSLDLAELINNQGLIYEDGEDAADFQNSKARRALIRGWEMRRQLAGDISAETGESLNNLGMYFLFHLQSPQQMPMIMQTLQKSLTTALKVYGPDNPETAVSYANLALALHLSRQDPTARENIDKAIKITEKTLGQDHPDRAYELEILGQIYQSEERTKDAEKCFIDAIHINQHTYGQYSPSVLSAMDYLHNLYQATGDDFKSRLLDQQIEALQGQDM